MLKVVYQGISDVLSFSCGSIFYLPMFMKVVHAIHSCVAMNYYNARGAPCRCYEEHMRQLLHLVYSQHACHCVLANAAI